MYTATVNVKTTLQLRLEEDSVHINDQAFDVNKAQLTELRSHWIVNGKSMNVEVLQFNAETKEFTIKVNNKPYNLQLKDRYDDLLKSLGMEQVGEKKMKEIKAPMPGLVLNVLVNVGDNVEKDTPLLILEAMKMENVIKAGSSAVVKKVKATKGVPVEKGAVLIEFQ